MSARPIRRAKGGGSIRQRSESSWELTIDLGLDGQGRRQRKFVSVKGKRADAERKLRELLTALDRGLPINTQKITLGQWLEVWMAEHTIPNLRPNTQERYRGIIDRHIIPRLGHLSLTRVSPTDIKSLQSALTAEGMAAAGVELVHTVLSGAFKYAVALEILWRNPAQSVRPPTRPNKEVSSSEIGEVRQMLSVSRSLKEPLYAALHLTAYTGLRRGEILGLKWSDLDYDHASITVQRALVRVRGLGLILQPTKTDGSRRRLDIDPDTVAVLRAHRVVQMEHRLTMDGAYEDNDLLFPNELGRPLNPMALTRAFKRLALKTGVAQTRLHSLRHFHASALFELGESPMLVSRRLGHASIKTTVDIYGHLFEGAQRAAAEKFARAMRGES